MLHELFAFLWTGWSFTWPTQLLALIWIAWLVSWAMASLWSARTGSFDFRLLQQKRHETDIPIALRNVCYQG